MAHETIKFLFKDYDVRVITIENEPWFMLKDVCVVLEIQNPTQAAGQIDDEDKAMLDIGLKNGAKVNFINEPGFYTLVLRSDKPQAKPFRKWVTSEVLPQIRKTGGYIPVTEEMSELEILSKGFLILKRTVDELKSDNKVLERQVYKHAPYWTLAEWKTFNDIAWDWGTTLSVAAKLGGFCREKGVEPRKVGKVNSYPERELMEFLETLSI